MARTQSGEQWAAFLREALADLGWTRAELARRLCGIVLSDSTISKWLDGRSVPEKLEVVIAVAHALGEPTALEALDAAGMHRAADLIRAQITAAHEDPMLVKIRTNALLTERERHDFEHRYRLGQANNVRLFELEMAEVARRRHAARDRRTTVAPTTPDDDPGALAR